MKTVRKLKLPFKLDVPTEAKGDCFPLSVLAQCRRPEIHRNFSASTRKIIDQDIPTVLKKAVRDFMITHTYKHIQAIKRYCQYQKLGVGPITGKS